MDVQNEEEDDDYMSDAFLNPQSTNDIRPSLLLTHNQQRLHNQMKKKQKCELQNKMTSIKVLEEQRRQEGLEKAIDSNNKGFSLLQKMGYKPGSGIGKNNCGRVEPIGIVLKSDRKGLGRDAALKEIRELKKSIIHNRQSTGPSLCEFREKQAQEANERLDRSDLLRCQRVCRQMDLEQGIQDPPEIFFWPDEPKDNVDEESINETEKHEPNVMTITEQLNIVNFYLRRTYNYCVYCGTVYEDEKDLNGECPGPNRQDH